MNNNEAFLWAVRSHPEPQSRQCRWLWACNLPGCEASGVGVNEGDADRHAADHHARTHAGTLP